MTTSMKYGLSYEWNNRKIQAPLFKKNTLQTNVMQKNGSDA
jgi:hypothetical protein